MHQPYANDNRLTALPRVSIELGKNKLRSIKWSFNPATDSLAEQVFYHLFSEDPAAFRHALSELPIIKRLPVYERLSEKPMETQALQLLRKEIKQFCIAVIADFTKETDFGYSLNLDERAKALISALNINDGNAAKPVEEIAHLYALLNEGCFRAQVPAAHTITQEQCFKL
ncbi:MAG: hypothetical protein K2Q12_09510 [Rickettsiales bacterium]|nr:hypothetical protein [Rickettsiales bacterium]